MDQTVYIPFNQKINPGDSVFSINIDKNYVNRTFEFVTLTLVPDFYSLQALEQGLHDHMDVDQVREKFSIDVYTNIQAYNRVKYVPFTTPLKVPEVLKYLNDFAESNKPEGILVPPIFFDWLHKDTINLDGHKRHSFIKQRCQEFYGKPFKREEHLTFLPDYMRSVDVYFNSFSVPTNEAVWNDIRIRITIMPNVGSVFSNDHLFKALGFSDEQSHYGNHVSPFRYKNFRTHGTDSLIAEGPPTKTSFVSNTTVFLHPLYSHYRSPVSYFQTFREHFTDPSLSIVDYSKNLYKIAYNMNLDFQITFDETERRFNFTFPQSELLNVILNVTPTFAYNVGFGHVRQITKYMTNLPQLPHIELKDTNKLAKIQVLDTGIVLVRHSGTQLMAVLKPQMGGYLTTKFKLPDAWITVSQFNPNVEFVLYTFNESNQQMLLDWKSGGWIRGVLKAKV